MTVPLVGVVVVPNASSRVSIEPSTPPAARGDRSAAVALLGWSALYVVVSAMLQMLGDVPFDADTAYHFAVTRLIARHGMLHSFPWTEYSVLARHYADKELIFHLLFLPFAGLSFPLASKLFGVVLESALLSVMAFILRRESVSRAGVWPLVALTACSLFTFRFALVRPHLIAVSLALLATWSAARARKPLLFTVAALYPLSYIAWHTPLLIVTLVQLAQLARGRERRALDLSLFGVVLAGIALGVAVHPDSLSLLRFWKVVHIDILVRVVLMGHTGFDMGAELSPMPAHDVARYGWIPIAFVLGATALGWRRRRDDATTLGFAFVALAFGVMALRSQRFFEYFVPFATVAFALSLRDLPWAAHRGTLVLGATAAITGLTAASPVTQLALRINDLPPQMARGLQRRVPEGALVFTCHWGQTGTFMLALPERHFLVALDPVLFFVHDPVKYRLWFSTVHTPPADASRVVREGFGARFVLCENTPDRVPFFRALRSDPTTRPTVISPDYVLFELGLPPPAPATPTTRP